MRHRVPSHFNWRLPTLSRPFQWVSWNSAVRIGLCAAHEVVAKFAYSGHSPVARGVLVSMNRHVCNLQCQLSSWDNVTGTGNYVQIYSMDVWQIVIRFPKGQDVLVTTQRHVQCILYTVSPKAKRPEREAGSSHSSPIYLHVSCKETSLPLICSFVTVSVEKIALMETEGGSKLKKLDFNSEKKIPKVFWFCNWKYWFEVSVPTFRLKGKTVLLWSV